MLLIESKSEGGWSDGGSAAELSADFEGKFQIAVWMLHNAPDIERFNEDQWINDTLSKAHCDDILWGYMSRISEQLHCHVPGEYGDDVLFKLLCMGVFDWTDEDHRTNASTQAMCHSTAMVHWVIERIKRVETTVSCLLISAYGDSKLTIPR